MVRRSRAEPERPHRRRSFHYLPTPLLTPFQSHLRSLHRFPTPSLSVRGSRIGLLQESAQTRPHSNRKLAPTRELLEPAAETYESYLT